MQRMFHCIPIGDIEEYKLKCVEQDCNNTPVLYYYNCNNKRVCICERHRRKHLYVYKTYTCFYCGRKFTHLKHPLKMGGRVVCRKCKISRSINMEHSGFEQNEGVRMRCLGGKVNIERH